MKGNDIIKINESNGMVEFVHCDYNDRVEVIFTQSWNGGVLVVVENNDEHNMPIGTITNIEPLSKDSLYDVVAKVIHLYETTHIITFANKLQDFESTFQKVA